ncbi:MAG: hypothetical protein JW894_01645 [Bacteroidales bacterium]|nr:hypothetical protein [Bacteroidales bacterium]
MFRRIDFVILVLTFQLFNNSSFGQIPVVKTSIDTNRITIGDQIKLKYEVEKNKQQPVRFPVYTESLTDGIEIVGAPVIDSLKSGKGLNIVSLQLTITSFDTGLYYIPPQPILVPLSGFTDTILTEPTYLEVLGVAIDTTGTIRDIKANRRAPVTVGEILIYSLPVLLILAIILIVIYYLGKKEKQDAEPIQVKPEEPPHITALRELDKIKAQKLWQQQKQKEYYTRITYVIRWYISKRFDIPALELTSDEILSQIRELETARINYDILEDLLSLADLVKFAKGETDPDENIRHLDNAFDFIKKTKDRQEIPKGVDTLEAKNE